MAILREMQKRCFEGAIRRLKVAKDNFFNRPFPLVDACPDKNAKIFVLHHRPEKFPNCFANSSLYVPIQCGRALGEAVNGSLGDNSGDNISNWNVYLNEMTAIYWIGCHYDEVGNPDYVGFNHYRRYLDWSPDRLEAGMVFASRYVGPKTNRDFFVSIHGAHYLDMYLDAVDTIAGDGRMFWERLHAFYTCNIFITDRETFMRYFAFIRQCIEIAIRLITENRDALDALPPYEKRIFGFILERMTGYWLWREKRAGRIRITPSRLRCFDMPNLETSNK